MFLPERLMALLAPHQCLVCSREGKVLCDACRQTELQSLPTQCLGCGKVQRQTGDVCTVCRKWLGMRRIYAASSYDGLAERLVHATKFDHKRQGVEAMASAIIDALPYFSNDVVVTFVPSSLSRTRERGFDHAYMLAKTVAKNRKLLFVSALGRVSNTRQVGASREKRIDQMQTAFRVRSDGCIKGATVLLIDDVMTSGASLAAATKLLKVAGANEVIGVVFARKMKS